MQYKIVRHGSSNHLAMQQEVNDLLAAGWKLHGVTQVFPIDRNYYVYSQAMVKESDAQDANVPE